ncbi:hypothetical protein PY092_19580 [Muricauda sp. 334s03]|uniref:Uncharacterized protein n=1 Tax=Flagellimonas yonaguniensis TaxID=3031325 RepID=A0ABT5Y4J1_9FLAO|nr:hypothetical protein [[Muricauda] yonaguniensis]MDF0718365.1 hypothetical protein [[Muricauda] yonaguniensis]
MAYLNKYESFLLAALEDKNVLVSGDICKLLENEFGIKNSNARKIIQRAAQKGLIKSSVPLTFGKGQFAYSNPTVNFTKDIIKLISKKHRPVLFRLLVALDVNKGILSYYEALKITASPLIKGVSKVDYLDDLIGLLTKFDIAYQKTDKNLVRYIILKGKGGIEESLMDMHFAKMSIDTVFIKDIIDWIVKSNLIDNRNVIYRNKTNPSKGAKHNNLVWDAFGYTKTTGLNDSVAKDSNSPEKQTLVVLDILINRDYEQVDLDGFLSRIQINLNSVSKGKRKVVPIIVYKNSSRLILNKIKKLGFLSYNVSSIYGSNIFNVLENISKLQLNKKLLEQDDIERIITDTLGTINASGQDDQLKAIKGTLFEVVMYQVLKHQYPNAEIKPNYYFSKNIVNKEDNTIITEGYEYDYVIKSTNPKEIIVVELKGYKSTYEIPLGDYKTKNTISWFFKKTLPFIKDKFKTDIGEGYVFKGCYITSSQYTKEAIDDLDKLKKGSLKPKRLDLFYNRQKLFDFLVENDFRNLKGIIEKFY